ncbi:hypothetical protein RRG08_036738 [Elysia crispata]|uniref:Uncharacterized protein n=1 Tax=Elysia crispata TaxID=231223 RepID=A0AAE0ZGJ4_9GAST|nr:hypothetical protein RRG08_036738 [Elysia crispata]
MSGILAPTVSNLCPDRQPDKTRRQCLEYQHQQFPISVQTDNQNKHTDNVWNISTNSFQSLSRQTTRQNSQTMFGMLAPTVPISVQTDNQNKHTDNAWNISTYRFPRLSRQTISGILAPTAITQFVRDYAHV